MTSKRKIHTKTNLFVPQVEHKRDNEGRITITTKAIPPPVTVVRFPHNPTTVRNIDFAPFYGQGIDEITYVWQRQIERFLDKQDGEREVSTVVRYARHGLVNFLPYLVIRSVALRRPLTLSDINRELVDGFLRHLSDSGMTIGSQRLIYNSPKSVLMALGQRGLIMVDGSGERRTFPANPFPNSARHQRGETPLSVNERKAFTAAVKTAVMPIFNDGIEVTGELLTYALLIVALHTGRNATPLLEMAPDSLRSHPKDNTLFLVLWKRRGYNTSKVALRDDSRERGIEAMPGVRLPVVRLIRRVIELAAPLRAIAPAHLADRVWLYRSSANANRGNVTALNNHSIYTAIKKLVAEYGLRDANENPMRINVSRLRKTFANRIFELLDQDLGSTAVALGNTPEVAGRNYLAPGADSQRNWKFMGEVLTKELLSSTLRSTEITPTGSCTDTINGQYAPKRDGKICFNFLNCLRCRNYVVTGDDLYKLFSFYWRVLRERERMDGRQWKRHYGHIPRLIERDVIAKGLAINVFKPNQVEEARDRARHDPHPYWQLDALASLEEFRAVGRPQEPK